MNPTFCGLPGSRSHTSDLPDVNSVLSSLTMQAGLLMQSDLRLNDQIFSMIPHFLSQRQILNVRI